MATATLDPAVTDIGSLLEVREGYLRARLCLKGTGVTVDTIAAHFRQNASVEELCEGFPQASRESVYAAVTHYLANKQQMDSELDADEAEFERCVEEQTARLIRERKQP